MFISIILVVTSCVIAKLINSITLYGPSTQSSSSAAAATRETKKHKSVAATLRETKNTNYIASLSS